MQPIILNLRYRAAALAAVVILSACGGSSTTGTTGGNNNPGGGGGGGGTPVATTSVAMTNSSFVPPAISVGPGAVVTFTNNDGTAHNVTFTSTAIGTIPDYTSGARTLTMPTAAGTYPYRCTIHAGMSGTVTVQ